MLAGQETIKSKDVSVLLKQMSKPEQAMLMHVEVECGDRIRGKTCDGEVFEGIADRVGHKYVRLSTGEALNMETVELLKAEGEGLAALETVGEPFAESPSDPASGKVAKQSWKLQAKPLIEQLLAVVPEGEDVREYLELVANSLKGKS